MAIALLPAVFTTTAPHLSTTTAVAVGETTTDALIDMSLAFDFAFDFAFAFSLSDTVVVAKRVSAVRDRVDRKGWLVMMVMFAVVIATC